jgi:hypothetical protein
VSGRPREARRPQILRQRLGGTTVVLCDAVVLRLDVRPVDVERDRRLFQRVVRVEGTEALELRREHRPRDLELRLVLDLRERARLARELDVQLCHRLLAGGVDEEGGDVVGELVARRPLDGPVAQTLARLEDLLDPDVVRAALAQPLEVRARSREPVGVIDAKPVDQAVVDELEHLRVRRLEHLRVLDPHAGEVADVEESAVPAAVGIPVEELRAQPQVAPERVPPRGRHGFGTMSAARRGPPRRHGAERAELGLAAQVLGDAVADDVAPCVEPLRPAARARDRGARRRARRRRERQSPEPRGSRSPP